MATPWGKPSFNKNIFVQDKHKVPIITAPIHMTATTMNHSKEITVGEWTPTKRSVHQFNSFYRVTHMVGKNLLLTTIWDFPSCCLSSR